MIKPFVSVAIMNLKKIYLPLLPRHRFLLYNNTMNLKVAEVSEIDRIFSLYKAVVEAVAKTPVKLGWRIDQYPSYEWVKDCVSKKEMLIFCEAEKIVAAACVNHQGNKCYGRVSWKVSEPAERISTIHAFCVDPSLWKRGVSSAFLKAILAYCKEKGDVANHLDVIDTNDKALKMYLKAGYEERAVMDMFYEVVGTRSFWMLEYIF